MENSKGQANIVDSAIEKVLVTFSQRMPRRRVMVLLGQYGLRILGITVVSVFPFDRVAQATTCLCTDLQYCGINGDFCGACPGGTCASCPTGASLGSSWMKCCNGGVHVYMDCCYKGAPPACCSQGGSCQRDCSAGAWCPPNFPNYCCTITRRGLACDS
jgi:hypothetical protein